MWNRRWRFLSLFFHAGQRPPKLVCRGNTQVPLVQFRVMFPRGVNWWSSPGPARRPFQAGQTE